jgi:hypothetical protein
LSVVANVRDCAVIETSPPGNQSRPIALLRLVLAVCAVSLTACVTRGPERRALDVIRENKQASLGDWKDLRTEGLASVHIFRAKTAMLVNASELLIDSHTVDGTVVAKFKIGIRGDGATGIGSAVPVTRDGYFLTAAHCVAETHGEKALTSVVALVDRNEGQFAQSPFRVVWQSPDLEALDLAIIHAPIRPWQAFDLAPSRTVKAELSVAAVGWSGIFEGEPLPAAAGRILEVAEPNAIGRELVHNVPLNQGDSGGPLIDRRGRLVAINYLIVTRTHPRLQVSARSAQRLMDDYRALAFAPDPAWVRRVIAQDRASRG